MVYGVWCIGYGVWCIGYGTCKVEAVEDIQLPLPLKWVGEEAHTVHITAHRLPQRHFFSVRVDLVDGIQRIYYGMVDGIQVRKVFTVSQSKSGNVWI
jgi:hypothetical protein